MSSKHKQLKSVLKRNELAIAVENVVSFIKDNAQVFWGLVIAVVALGVTLLGLQLYQQSQVKTFNEKWQAVNDSLLKEQNLKDLIAAYPSIPARNLASFELAQYQLENQKPAEALQTLAAGLNANEANILTTVLVLKSVEIYKSQKQFAEAAQFLEKQQGQILPNYLPYTNLQKADLYVAAGDEAKARLLYTQLAQPIPETVKEVGASQAAVNKMAKERLLQLELKTK